MAITYMQSENSRRFKALVTVTAGTPIQLLTGPQPIKADRLLIIMLPGGTGIGKVYDDVPPNTAAASIAAACGTPVPLGAADSGGVNPGGAYSDTAEANGFIDLRCIALDGSQTGDQMLIDAHLKI